jgi:adenylate cyclase
MTEALEYRIYVRQQHVYIAELSGPVELGRQDKGEEAPFHHRAAAQHTRLIVARFDEDTISRKHVHVEPLTDGKIQVTNLSKTLPIVFQSGGDLLPLATRPMPTPVVFTIGNKTVRVQKPDVQASSLQSLGHATVLPGSSMSLAAHKTSLPFPAAAGIDVESIVRWLQATMDVLQSAASSEDFFTRAARAVVDLVGLDSGGVLLREASGWRVQALESAASVRRENDWQPSRQILGRVQAEKRTFWEVPAALAGSLLGVKAVVAAPILNRSGDVIGVLYGDRRQETAKGAGVISKLEAMLVEVLATGVAAGLSRLEQEQAALRACARFEEFFTPELSRLLLAQPELLHCRETDVSVLVCDIRGFSRISERLGPAVTGEWISDTLGALSELVLAEQGVLVDYTGDELMAMWGAPLEQADHARRACRTGLAMLNALPTLNERWQQVLNEPTQIGIGINSGPARVGNVGSRIKFKYGVLGYTVNLASRVQGATKYLQCPLLITEATRTQAGAGFATRRLCQVRVVNMVHPVALCELVGTPTPSWYLLRKEYEEALSHFESGECQRAAAMLASRLAEDGAARVLHSRAEQFVAGEHGFDAVWELPGK